MDTPAWDVRIEDAGLSARTANALKDWDFSMLSDVADMSRAALLRICGIGHKGAEEIMEAIKRQKELHQPKPVADAIPTAQGMTLRDWFAGQALAWAGHNEWFSHEPKHVAERAYRMADAMLAARSGK